MTIINEQELVAFRNQLEDNPIALKALAEIEACEGDIEDAAISIAIRVGQQPQQDNQEWLDALARRCRAVICQEILREQLHKGEIAQSVAALAQTELIPAPLATPVIIYVLKQGLEPFCEPLTSLHSL